jgi:glycosyltransferase involved in cell wall biosynthesis
MKIGFDATPLHGQRSGVGHYTGRLLAAQLALRPDWQPLLYSNQPLGQLEQELAGARQIEGYFPQSRWLWMQLFLPKILSRSQPTLCHYTNASAPLLSKQPFVLTIHDASLFLFQHLHPRKRLLAIKLLLPIMARRAQKVITVSEKARQDLMRALQLPADKIETIHEAAPANFKPVVNAGILQHIRQKYHLPDQFILYVGALEPRKNLYRLAEAVANMHKQGIKAPLVMVGPQGWHMTDFKHKLSEWGIEKSVHYLGYVPTEELPAIYSLATIFAFPSLYEGFGLPVLEAMACGTPVLTSQDSSMSEICGDAALLVDPLSVHSIEVGLKGLWEDGECRHFYSQQGIERATYFSWEKTAQQTMQLYESAIVAGGK